MKITVVLPKELMGGDVDVVLMSLERFLDLSKRSEEETVLISLPDGVSMEEYRRDMAAAELRLAALDELEPKCNWSSACPSLQELEARKKWKRIMDVQSLFECKYDA